MGTPDAKAHLTFGGSSAHRWLACPGSASLCATLPPQVENEHMAAGTRAHALLELAVRERRDSVLEFDGVSLQAGWPAFELDDVEAVQKALDHVNEILVKHPDAVLWVERQFTLPMPTPTPIYDEDGLIVGHEPTEIGGTADVVIYVPSLKLLIVIDYKHGRGKYVPETTPQMRLYAACVLFGLPDLLVERIDATIIQPRCQAGEPIRTAIYSPGDLIAFSDDVDAAVALATTEAPELIPGETQCHWCPAAMAAACPALFKGAVAVPNQAVEWAGSSPDETVTVTLPSVEAMRRDPAKLFETLKMLPLLYAWGDGLEAAAESIATGGGPTPGFKMVEKVARRKWQDEEAARRWFAEQTMLDDDEYAPRKLVSPAQGEKLVKLNVGKDGVKAMAEHVVKQSSGLKLVPEDAKGDAVNPLAVAEAGFASAVTI